MSPRSVVVVFFKVTLGTQRTELRSGDGGCEATGNENDRFRVSGGTTWSFGSEVVNPALGRKSVNSQHEVERPCARSVRLKMQYASLLLMMQVDRHRQYGHCEWCALYRGWVENGTAGLRRTLEPSNNRVPERIHGP